MVARTAAPDVTCTMHTCIPCILSLTLERPIGRVNLGHSNLIYTAHYYYYNYYGEYFMIGLLYWGEQVARSPLKIYIIMHVELIFLVKKIAYIVNCVLNSEVPNMMPLNRYPTHQIGKYLHLVTQMLHQKKKVFANTRAGKGTHGL